MDSQRKLRKLRCSVQCYDWGRLGRHSRVADLFGRNSGSEIRLDRPYAELWMGTHDSGPSFIAPASVDGGVSVGSKDVKFKSWLAENPDVIGDKVFDKWGCDLPFLFKVLSVAKALSIQAHPDKELARVLHKARPDLYKDDNHKPEMALAITEFEALCGFTSLQELKGVFLNVPEIVELVGSANANQILNLDEQKGEEKAKSVLQSTFTQLMLANKETVAEVISKIKSRLQSESQVRQLTDKELLVLRLEKQYPGDIGVISAFFFNHLKLNPGEALYLGANEPHAYILGECIECMATSDNVVRAGLTPKHKDVETLCSMLTYKQGLPEILQGVPVNEYVRRYLPPLDEFEVDSCILPQGASTVFPAVPGPSIFVIMEGKGVMQAASAKGDVVTEGDVVFAPANTDITITSTTELQLYRAGVSSRFFEE